MTQVFVVQEVTAYNPKPDARGNLPVVQRNRLSIANLTAAVFLILSGYVSGCQSGGSEASSSRSDRRSEGQQLFSGGPSGAGLDESEAWSIVIVAFSGQPGVGLDQQARLQAQEALARVHETGLRDAYLEQRGDRLVLGYGKYPGPDDPRAQRDLETVRGIEWQGENPFAVATIVPPAGAVLGSYPEYNLQSVKQRFGFAAKYTLMVANYSRPVGQAPSKRDLEQFRKSAEEATLVYRREGEQAFYHHGLNSSSVTIGVFGDEALQGSPLLSDLRRRHPHLLVNGAGQRVNGQLVPTRLVGIPDAG